uniref:Uncharacterized protein n=1 Tax=Arundo donax TaxID=35708 RepID=A0A0A9BM18_ARUDO
MVEEDTPATAGERGTGRRRCAPMPWLAASRGEPV